MILRLLIVFLLLASLSRADDFQLEGALSTRVGLSQEWDVVLRARSRIRPAEPEFTDASLIPIFGFQAHRNVRLYAGHYFSRRNLGELGWKTVLRPMGGIEPALNRERFTIKSRTGFERLVVLGGPDTNRYRQRFRILGDGLFTPYANVELFFANEGYTKTRYGGGVRRDIGESNGIEFSYWFEDRRFLASRHMISVSFHFRFKGLAPDF